MQLFRRQPKKNPELEERLSHLRSSRQRQLWPADSQTPEGPSMAAVEAVEEEESTALYPEGAIASDAVSATEETAKAAFSATEAPDVSLLPQQTQAPDSYAHDVSSDLPSSAFTQKGARPNMEPMEPIRREHLPYPDLAEPAVAPRREPSNRGEGTRIDRQSHLNGTLRSDGDIYIEGTVEGEIECAGTVYIEENATVSATVKARSAVIAGHASGDFTCEERLVIKASGEMRGKAQAAALIVEEGAFFEGEFKMATGSTGATSFGSWSQSAAMEPAISQDEEGI